MIYHIIIVLLYALCVPCFFYGMDEHHDIKKSNSVKTLFKKSDMTSGDQVKKSNSLGLLPRKNKKLSKDTDTIKEEDNQSNKNSDRRKSVPTTKKVYSKAILSESKTAFSSSTSYLSVSANDAIIYTDVTDNANAPNLSISADGLLIYRSPAKNKKNKEPSKTLSKNSFLTNSASPRTSNTSDQSRKSRSNSTSPRNFSATSSYSSSPRTPISINSSSPTAPSPRSRASSLINSPSSSSHSSPRKKSSSFSIDDWLIKESDISNDTKTNTRQHALAILGIAEQLDANIKIDLSGNIISNNPDNTLKKIYFWIAHEDDYFANAQIQLNISYHFLTLLEKDFLKNSTNIAITLSDKSDKKEKSKPCIIPEYYVHLNQCIDNQCSNNIQWPHDIQRKPYYITYKPAYFKKLLEDNANISYDQCKIPFASGILTLFLLLQLEGGDPILQNKYQTLQKKSKHHIENAKKHIQTILSALTVADKRL